MTETNGWTTTDHDEQVEAELLERFWDELASDVESPQVAQLDPELATLSRRLYLDAVTDNPSPESLARLSLRIDAGLSDAVNWRAGASRPWRRAWPLWRPRSAAAVLMAAALTSMLLLAGIMQYRGEDGAISAAEVLRAARAAAVPTHEASFERTEVDAIADAQELATFHVRTPHRVPDEFAAYEVVHQRWPYADEEVHADFVLVRYRTPEGHWLEIWQGFTAPYLSFQTLAPEDRTGLLSVRGKEAAWIEGRPLDHSGTWDPEAQTTLGILEGYEGGSPRFTVLASDALSVEDLVGIAESLQ